MADGGPGRFVEIKPHAYDPVLNPELFEGVLARRMIAFVIDLVIITVPIIMACIFIFLFGVITFGLGWALYFLLVPGSVIWALVYYGATMGSPASATIGMRTVDIEVRTWYGAPCYFVLGAVHAIAFWITTSALTPLVLLVGLLNERRRLLHDFLLGTVVINNEYRAAALRHYGH
ncbi:MAG TPA: RDD family protein [Xanthobacteraceae bacterium]|nr:RDD family protein [Xanthobacteraceae bacterium]